MRNSRLSQLARAIDLIPTIVIESYSGYSKDCTQSKFINVVGIFGEQMLKALIIEIAAIFINFLLLRSNIYSNKYFKSNRYINYL